MLFALRQPATLLGLVLGYGLGCFLRATAQRAVKGGLRSAGRSRLAGATSPRNWLDPFGTVGAVLGGVGWSPRPDLGHRDAKRQVWVVTVVALAVHAVLAFAGIAAYVAAGGPRSSVPFIPTLAILHGSQVHGLPAGQQIALGFGIINLACGLLVLLPLPPLELGVALWSTLPRSPGARRMAYRLLEEQWSVAIVLVLLLFPLAGEQPALLQLVDSLGNRILGLF